MTPNPDQINQIMRKMKDELNLTGCEIRIIILMVFPNKDVDLDSYFNQAYSYLANAGIRSRLHIDVDNYTALVDLMGGPRDPLANPPNTNGTPGTWNYVYPLEKAKGTFTHPLKTEKDKLIIQIKAAFATIFSDIPDSAILPADTTNLLIKPKSSRKKRQNVPKEITEVVHVFLIPLGGGKMKVICRKEKNSKRGSKLNRKTDIEIAWVMIERKAIIPNTSASCPNKQVISTSKFVLEIAADDVGMRMVLFARWVYVKHPKQSGEFGTGANEIVT